MDDRTDFEYVLMHDTTPSIRPISGTIGTTKVKNSCEKVGFGLVIAIRANMNGSAIAEAIIWGGF